MTNFSGVPGAPAPEFLPGSGVVPGQGVASGDEELQGAARAAGGSNDRSGKGFKGFCNRVALALGLPGRLAGGEVIGLEIGGDVVGALLAPSHSGEGEGDVPLEDLHDEVALEKNRAGREGPLEGKVFIALGNEVAAPDFLALHVVNEEVGVAEEEGHVLPVSHGGGVGEVASVVEVDLPLAHKVGPENLAGGGREADGMDLLSLVIDGIDEDVVSPDDGCRIRGAGQFSLPGDVFGGGELGGELEVITAAAIEVGATLVRPVGGGQQSKGEEEQREEESRSFHGTVRQGPRGYRPVTQ